MDSFSTWISSLDVLFEKEGETAWHFPEQGLRIQYPGNVMAGQGIRVWAGQWKYQKEITQSRIRSRLGLLDSLPGRVCQVKKISQPTAAAFLRAHHMQGSTAAKTKFGLYLPEKYYRLLPFRPEGEAWLVGVMTFSGGRTFRDGSRSYELIRFAMHRDVHVKGGFSKLLRAFEREKEPDSIMTYVDLEWYKEGVYSALGFEESGCISPQRFSVDEEGTWNGHGEEYENKGSLKMVWKKR